MSVLFICIGFSVALIFAFKCMDSVDVRRFYFLDYLESWHCGMSEVYKRAVYKMIGECKALGLLSEDDLYIDLTGGADMCGLSDNQLFSLRMHQMCGNGVGHRSATNLVFSSMKFDIYDYGDLTGEWGWYVWGGWIDSHKSWGKLDNDFVKEHATLGKGEVFIDSGSGNSVRAEWRRKLNKITWACDEVERRKFANKVEQINKRIEELK